MAEVSGTYRRNGKNIYIKQPDYNELSFVSRLWSDEETMKDVGGVFNFPESKWEMFYKKMVYPTDGKNFYCLVYTIRDKAVGEVSFHGFDSVTKIARFNVKIHHKYRNKGYGEEALKLLFEYFFLEFGGEMIMDSIPTEKAVRIAKRLGFSEVGQYKDGTKMKVTKDEFLNYRKESLKKVAILAYNGMDMNDYACIHDSLNLVNKIYNEIFQVSVIALNERVTLSNGLVLDVDSENLDTYSPDIIVMPGGNNIEKLTRNNEIIKFILKNFNNCDYICAQGEGIRFLLRCRSLDGIMVPRFCKEIENYISKDKISDKNFCDDGKILLSSNYIGNFEMIISIVGKVGGLDVANKVKAELGFKEYELPKNL
ncbi:MAG: GNAT family N-acetyltransferase [Clostridium sp.]|nr:GNAT family N-acetyltransferase [Clostridium sp.]